MILHEYQFKNNVKPVSKLEEYCKLEGLDALYIRSTDKKGKGQLKLNNFIKLAKYFLIYLHF